jgi:hypothetical protein
MLFRINVAVVLVLSLLLTGCVEDKPRQATKDATVTGEVQHATTSLRQVASTQMRRQQCTVTLRAGTLPKITIEGKRRVGNNEGSMTIKGTLLNRNNDWVEIDAGQTRYSIPVDRIAFIQFPKADAHGDHDHIHHDHGLDPGDKTDDAGDAVEGDSDNTDAAPRIDRGDAREDAAGVEDAG